MGYEVNEIPMVSATIYYHDCWCENIDEITDRVLFSLEKYGYFPAADIRIIKSVIVNGVFRQKFIPLEYQGERVHQLKSEIRKSFFDKTVGLISFSNMKKNVKVDNGFWNINWGINNEFPLYNLLEISSTYDRLTKEFDERNFMRLVEELCQVLHAFYAFVEDVSTNVDVLDATKETVFTDSYLQTIHWGNFFGKKICEDIGMKKLQNIPVANKKLLKDGFFFTLSDNIRDSKDSPTYKFRKKIYKYLNPSRKNHIAF